MVKRIDGGLRSLWSVLPGEAADTGKATAKRLTSAVMPDIPRVTSLGYPYNKRLPPLGTGPTGRFFSESQLRDELFGTEQARKKTVLVDNHALPFHLRHSEQTDVTLRTVDGNVLKGRFYEPSLDAYAFFGDDMVDGEPNRHKHVDGAVVLLLSDAGENGAEGAIRTAACYAKYGARVLTVDYGGFGRSNGTPNEATLKRDADAMWHYLTREKGIAPQNIVVHGSGLGASLAAYVAKRADGDCPVAALVLHCPVASASEALRASGSVRKRLSAAAVEAKLGKFSVMDNLGAGQLGAPIIVATDEGKLGPQGERLRKKLEGKSKFEIGGENVGIKQDEGNVVISSNMRTIGEAINKRR